MKRFSALFFALFSLFLIPIVPAHSENLQIVMPRLIYIGDTIEIRSVFHSDALIFGGDFAEKPSATIPLRTDYEFFLTHEADFCVKAASLEKLNSEYTLNLTVIPWKTGFLQIPPFSLTSLVAFSQNEKIVGTSPSMTGNRSSTPFIVSLSPIEVKSLVQKTGNHSFLPQASPLVLPGTTALLVFLALFALAVFSAILFVLLHLPRVARFIENLTALYSLKKNSRKAVKKIRALQKESEKIPSDKDFAEGLQHILRAFLNKRFAQNFSSVTTNALYPLFIALCGGDLGEHQENAVEHLIALFNRLDFIRFSEHARFLSASENNGKSERDSVCENAITMIEEFDDDSDFENEKEKTV